MDKINYITRQFSRAEKKRFEHYVVTRIWHLLNDLSVKFVTQQYVTRPEGRALTDMYFPQLKIHIEIDEGQHLTKANIDSDKVREADIINATGHQILRVDVTKDVYSINEAIDNIVFQLRVEKAKQPTFQPWDIEAEQTPQIYIDKGYISIEDDVAFNTCVDAANCFGHNYKGLQKGGVDHPMEENTIIWFPKLYENEEWLNSISNDEKEIIEVAKLPEEIKKHVDKHLKSTKKIRIVFARVKSPLGDVMYRFKGSYKLNVDKSSYKTGLIWDRISTKVNTYKPITQ